MRLAAENPLSQKISLGVDFQWHPFPAIKNAQFHTIDRFGLGHFGFHLRQKPTVQ